MRRLTAMTAMTAIALCLAPAMLVAQESAQTTRTASVREAPTNTAAQDTAAKPQARKSMMNLVMAALIHSAELQSAQQRGAASPAASLSPASEETQPPAGANGAVHRDTAAEGARRSAEREQVALQSDGTL